METEKATLNKAYCCLYGTPRACLRECSMQAHEVPLSSLKNMFTSSLLIPQSESERRDQDFRISDPD